MPYILRKYDGHAWVSIAKFDDLDEAKEHAREFGFRIYRELNGELLLVDNLNHLRRN